MFNPVTFYRMARWMYQRHIPGLPRIIKGISELLFHCVLPYTAEIGQGFEVGYKGFGIVVHARCVIGNNVFISPCVTIGGRSGKEGVPQIHDNVYISSGARILGDISVGEGSVVGANAVVIRSVPAHSIAAGVPAKIIREGIDVRDYTGWPPAR